jgi:hypothetical protein
MDLNDGLLKAKALNDTISLRLSDGLMIFLLQTKSLK